MLVFFGILVIALGCWVLKLKSENESLDELRAFWEERTEHWMKVSNERRDAYWALTKELNAKLTATVTVDKVGRVTTAKKPKRKSRKS